MLERPQSTRIDDLLEHGIVEGLSEEQYEGLSGAFEERGASEQAIIWAAKKNDTR